MHSRERLLAALRGERVDRLPWVPLLDGYYMTAQPLGTDILDAYREVGADVMERAVWTYGWNLSLPRDPDDLRRFEAGETVRFVDEGIAVSVRLQDESKGRMLTRTYEIPGRTLAERALYTEQSPYIPFPVEMLVKDSEDLEAYQYIVERRQFFPNYEAFAREDERIGDAGIATDAGPATPIQEVLQHVIGIEPFYTTFYTEDLPQVESLLRTMHKKNLEAYEIIAGSTAEVVIGYENTSVSYISPSIYEKHVSPCINDYADLLHERKKLYLTHRCGLLQGLLEIIGRERDDGVVDICPAPTGDTSLWEAKQAWPDKVVIGGIDPTFLTNWSADRLRAYVEEIHRQMRGCTGVMIGSGDAVPKDAVIENLKAVGDVVRDWRHE